MIENEAFRNLVAEAEAEARHRRRRQPFPKPQFIRGVQAGIRWFVEALESRIDAEEQARGDKSDQGT